MSGDIQIDSLTFAQKIDLLETVWDSLCRDRARFQVPDWHSEILEERRMRLESGEATLVSLEDVKTRLNQLGK